MCIHRCLLLLAAFLFAQVPDLSADEPFRYPEAKADKGELRIIQGVPVVVFAQMKDRTAKVAKDVKILDERGKELADGLKATELKEGASVVLMIEREGDKPVIHSIRVVKKGEKPPPREEPQVDTSKLVPPIDLGNDENRGFKGGLYPDGKNGRPAVHEK